MVSRQSQARVNQASVPQPAKQSAFAPAQRTAKNRQMGNQAVQRLLRAGVIQPKLTINHPGDRFEQEADRVAEEVMRMPEPQALEKATISGSSSPARIQRVCRECGEELSRRPVAIQRMCPECEEELRRQPMEEEEEEETIQAKEISGRTPEITPDVQAQINGLRGSGQPLPESVRAFFEPRFGYDFSQVRVHRDARAAESAWAMNARAYTVGQDIVFPEGEYAPETIAGRKLIAHELAHTVQQGNQGSPAAIIQRTIGDGHDLKSSRFTGDPVLEAVFDNERLLHIGNRGEAVRKIQQALVDAGFALPRFGVDGIFGLETRGAVKQFQTVFGLLIDGIVGPQTMGRLDEHYETPNPPPVCPVVPPPETVATFEAGVEVTTPPSQCRVPPGIPLGKGCPTPGTSGVTGIHEAQDNFSGRSTTRFGVGEVVNLSFDSPLSKGQPAGKKAVPHGGLQWVQKSGPGSLTSTDPLAGTGTFTADENAGRVRLELQVAVGPCKGSTVAKVRFRIVRPNDVNMTAVPGTAPNFAPAGPIPAGIYGAGFQANVFVDPKDVSFQGVVFGEGTVPGVVKPPGGFLRSFVHPVNTFGPGHGGNATTGTPVSPPVDRIVSERKGPAKTVFGVPICGHSDFLWAIPWEFSVAGSPRIGFATANQHWTSTAPCEATIEKGGAGPFCRRINGTTC